MSFTRYDSYRQSGADWLGSIPEHWSAARVKTLFEIRKRIAGELGYDVLTVTQQGLKVRDIDSNDGQLSMDYSKYQLVEPADFVMNHMDLLTGYVDLSRCHGVTSPDYRVFAARRKDLSLKYFLYLFQSGYQQKIFYAFGQGASGLGRWRMPTDSFNDFILPVPPLVEQFGIAKFLDRETAKIDELVEEQRDLIELLKEKRETIISHAVTKGLDPNAPMKSSGAQWLGKVPGHWEVKRVKHLVASKAGPFGSSLTKDQYVSYGYRVYGQEQVIPGDFSIGDYYISEQKFGELEQYEVRPGDVLVSCVGTFGRVAVVPDNAEPGVINPRLIRLRIRSPLLPKYLEAVLRSRPVYEQFSVLSRGGTMDVINIETLSGIIIAMPPVQEQHEILEHLDQRTGEIDALVNQSERAVALLSERRAALISAAVTGKIDVRKHVDADGSIREVVAA